MSKVILSEFISPSIGKNKVTLEEAEDAFGNKGKHLYMAGIFIQGDIRNANQRVYPVHEIKKAVDSMNNILLDSNGGDILGEMDHLDDLKINLDRVTHKIVKMSMEGPNGVGKLQILPTPMGNIVKTMLESGVKLGVSSRGSGNVNEANGHVSDFEIITVDIVAQPSAPNAYPKAIYESLMNMRHGHKVLEMAADTKVQRYIKGQVIRLIQDMKLK